MLKSKLFRVEMTAKFKSDNKACALLLDKAVSRLWTQFTRTGDALNGMFGQLAHHSLSLHSFIDRTDRMALINRRRSQSTVFVRIKC